MIEAEPFPVARPTLRAYLLLEHEFFPLAIPVALIGASDAACAPALKDLYAHTACWAAHKALIGLGSLYAIACRPKDFDAFHLLWVILRYTKLVRVHPVEVLLSHRMRSYRWVASKSLKSCRSDSL